MTSNNMRNINQIHPPPFPNIYVSEHRMCWISFRCPRGQVAMIMNRSLECFWYSHQEYCPVFGPYLLHKWKYLVDSFILIKHSLSVSRLTQNALKQKRYNGKPGLFVHEQWRHTLLSSGITLGITLRSHSPLFSACSYSINWPMKLKLGEMIFLLALTSR